MFVSTARRGSSLLLFACLLFAAGCGGDDDGNGESDQQEPQTGHPADGVGAPATPAQPPVEVAVGEPVQPVELSLAPESGQTYYATLRAGIRTAEVPGYVDWSPDGQWILTGDPQARLYSVKTGELTRDFGESSIAAFHPNGQQVVGVGNNGLLLWDVTTGNVAQRVPGPRVYSPQGMQVSRNGEKVLCTSYSSAVLFDLKKGNGRKVEVEDLASVAVSDDAKMLAVGTEDGKLLLLDADTLQPTRTLVEQQEKEDIRGVAFSPDGALGRQFANDRLLRWRRSGVEYRDGRVGRGASS